MSDVSPVPSSESPEKRVYVADLVLGGELADIFLLASAHQGQAKNGPYWRLEFRDASGSIDGKIWSPQSQLYPALTPGMAVWVKGRVSSYRDRMELHIDSLRILDEAETSALDMARFMPASPYNPDAMLAELLRLAHSVLAHKPWRKLVTTLLKDETITQALRRASAAKAMHHAYAGGLLEHTLSVARLCLRIADNYPYLDRQVLFAGAICHDLGKIWELNVGLSIDYTTSGRLVGHISLLMEKLDPFLKKSGLEPELVEHLHHLILSHHGTHEFGSPRLPATAEALVLHYADNIDAKLQQVGAALTGIEQGGWSAYVPALERFVYHAPPSPDAPSPMARPAAALSGSEKTCPLPLFNQCLLPSKG